MDGRETARQLVVGVSVRMFRMRASNCVLTYGFWPANHVHNAECTEYERFDTAVELFTSRSVSRTNTIHGAAHAPGADQTGGTGSWSFI